MAWTWKRKRNSFAIKLHEIFKERASAQGENVYDYIKGLTCNRVATDEDIYAKTIMQDGQKVEKIIQRFFVKQDFLKEHGMRDLVRSICIVPDGEDILKIFPLHTNGGDRNHVLTYNERGEASEIRGRIFASVFLGGLPVYEEPIP